MINMHHQLSRLSIGVALALLSAVPAIGSDPVRVGAYDFSYLSSGDSRAKPVQVFDDGQNTFFQFRAGEAVPAIFSTRTGAPQLVVPMQEGPYIKVQEVHGRFVLQVGRAQAQVMHGGGGRIDAPAINVMTPAGLSLPYKGGPVSDGNRLVATVTSTGSNLDLVDDARERNSYATPRKGDAVTWVEPNPETAVQIGFKRSSAALTEAGKRTVAAAVRSAPGYAKFTVVGRDDDSYKEGLGRDRAQTIRGALIKAGVPADRITTRIGESGSAKGADSPATLIVEATRGSVAKEEGHGRQKTIVSSLDALVRAGVLGLDQAQAIARHHGAAPAQTAAAQPAPEVPAGGFNLAVTDGTIQNAIRRWASQLKYDVVWEVPSGMDAPILGEIKIPASNILEALERLLVGLKDKGYALDAEVFANRVIRITAAQPQPSKSAPAPLVPNRAEPKKEPGRTVAQNQWEMLKQDRTVQGMFARWAEDAQWRLVWTAPERVAITGDAQISSPSIVGAAEQVIAQASTVGYRLRVSSPGDRTLLVSSY